MSPDQAGADVVRHFSASAMTPSPHARLVREPGLHLLDLGFGVGFACLEDGKKSRRQEASEDELSHAQRGGRSLPVLSPGIPSFLAIG